MNIPFQLAILESELIGRGAQFTPLGLELPGDMAFDAWVVVGRRIARADQVVKWWLGDWAAFGLHKYGKLKEFAEANGIDYQTLRNLAWVSQSVELSRRRDNLEWSKHAEVAALPAADQVKWLGKMEAENLPRAELRRQIRQSQGEHNALESDGPVVPFIGRAVDDLVHWLKGRPAEFWSEERKGVWRKRLGPIVEFYQTLE
jgi:hypothetical protein